MSPLLKLLKLLAPHECLGCGIEPQLLCKSCYVSQKHAQALSIDSIDEVLAIKVADELLVAAVVKAKYERARDFWFVLAKYVASDPKVVKYFEARPGALLCPVPTIGKHVRERGFDHAKIFAKALGREAGVGSDVLLKHTGSAHQVGASRKQRLAQAKGAFEYVGGKQAPKHVILVDDVTTTGSTLHACALELRRAGVKRVDALVIAHKA